MFNDTFLLSAIIFLPSVGALALGLFNIRSESAMRSFANVVKFLTFILTLFAAHRFEPSVPGMQLATTNVSWISSWNVNYTLGVDGISLPLVVLTGLISWLSMLASGSVTKQVRGYLIL